MISFYYFLKKNSDLNLNGILDVMYLKIKIKLKKLNKLEIKTKKIDEKLKKKKNLLILILNKNLKKQK